MDARLAALTAAAMERLHLAARAIRDAQPTVAEQLLQVSIAQTGHPEAMRLLGILRRMQGRNDEAIVLFQNAMALWPDDAQCLGDLAGARIASGDREGAIADWRRAAALAPRQPMHWFNLGRNLQLLGESAAALDALERAADLAPDFLPAHVLAGDALVHLGEFDRAERRYRSALSLQPACGDAWRGLANIKTRTLGEADRDELSKQLRRGDIADTDRIAMGHALGKLEEDSGRYPQAFQAISEANALMRRGAPWSAQALSDFVDKALAASLRLPPPVDVSLGREIIFIVGLPRSGSTLLEQMLAAHPEVEGASELPDLGEIIQLESQRRRRPYPDWIVDANAEDWQRLGTDYLLRTARWRQHRRRSTDKMPENWKHAGVLRAMLPGALVVDMRRDPVETGWSCYKQQFYQRPHFSCDLRDIAAYVHHCERAMDAWRQRDPERILSLAYESLLADPETQLRRLLDRCGLPWDPACLDFHKAGRSVRTASAAQVRAPLRGDTARASHYGALLDPLREQLAALRSGRR
ncbi:tetratricopeptide repeat-containing sulfotransferase family protein [Arenimonas sp.]|uniref:tetratricopeptide repeat-containing sulfotransferase family protein n=1 Tax=Arenimonas sp. TaxID=1872635 RepID=UPI0039E42F53